MFVSRSKFEEKEAQVQLLEKRLQETLDKISLLEAENAELTAALETANHEDVSTANATVVKCLVDSLSQVEGVRETVLRSYERINEESKSITLLLADSIERPSKKLELIILPSPIYAWSSITKLSAFLLAGQATGNTSRPYFIANSRSR